MGKSIRDTNHIGNISEAAIITRFLQLSYTVLTPFGGGQRYDLVIEDREGQFLRIQCKTARVNENDTMLIFNASISNVTGKNRQARHYRGQCDYFAAYCQKLNKLYLIPVDQVGTNSACLRLVAAKDPRHNTLWAKDFEL